MILRMFDHVTIRVSDLDASRRFYELFLGAPSHGNGDLIEWNDFSILRGRPTRHLHVGFAATSRAEVDRRWEDAVAAGHRSDGEPGPRPQYSPEYYGAFVLDPDGNSVEAVHNGNKNVEEAFVDHLWIGVRDLAATRRFWETVVPALGLRFTARLPERFHVAVGDRSFGLVADGRPPTENLHIAFPVTDDAAVAEFHRVAVAAGYRDNGPPGERPQYHAGYVAAFVLDPDGTNVEAVNHNR
jgi:catechol 2,3-dioxygenase-like lactoylglutathione lyase family enzyme